MATVSQIVELRGLCFHTLFGAAPPLKGSHSLCVTALGLRLGQKSRECGVLQEFNERSDWNTLTLKKTTGANQGNKERQKRNNDERGEVWGRGRWYCIANEEQERRCAQPLRSISAFRKHTRRPTSHCQTSWFRRTTKKKTVDFTKTSEGGWRRRKICLFFSADYQRRKLHRHLQPSHLCVLDVLRLLTKCTLPHRHEPSSCSSLIYSCAWGFLCVMVERGGLSSKLQHSAQWRGRKQEHRTDTGHEDCIRIRDQACRVFVWCSGEWKLCRKIRDALTRC